MPKILVTLSGDVVKALDERADSRGRSALIDDILRAWVNQRATKRIKLTPPDDAKVIAPPTDDDMAAMLGDE